MSYLLYIHTFHARGPLYERPSWDETTSIQFQLRLLYVITSILISILKLSSKLNYLPVTLHICQSKILLTLKFKIYQTKIIKNVSQLYCRADSC